MKVDYRSFLVFFLIVGLVYSIFLIEGYVTNGEEPDWNPEKWTTYEKVNNCYAYALDNHKKRDGKPQPDDQDPDKFTCRNLVKWIKRDLVDRSGRRYPLRIGYFDQPCSVGLPSHTSHYLYIRTSIPSNKYH